MTVSSLRLVLASAAPRPAWLGPASTAASTTGRRALHGDGRRGSIIEIPAEAKLPKETEVVIAGSGLIGNAVAYHLTQRGWKDITVIDKNRIADGTSKHGSGMLGMFRPTHERKIVQYCVELYRKLQDSGFDIGLQVSSFLVRHFNPLTCLSCPHDRRCAAA